jgi:hypothetical protein
VKKKKGRMKNFFFEKGEFRAPDGTRPATRGRSPVAATALKPSDYVPFYIYKLIIFKKKLEVQGMGQAFWKNECIALPFFEACPYTWKC